MSDEDDCSEEEKNLLEMVIENAEKMIGGGS